MEGVGVVAVKILRVFVVGDDAVLEAQLAGRVDSKHLPVIGWSAVGLVVLNDLIGEGRCEIKIAQADGAHLSGGGFIDSEVRSAAERESFVDVGDVNIEGLLRG